MKKCTTMAIAALLLVACNNNETSKEGSAVAPAAVAAEKIDYAYLPSNHPADYWDRGDQKNIAMVLKSLKAFETGNVEESLADFADSVRYSVDGFDAKVSKDSLRAMFKEGWKNMSAMKVDMGDYETVISKDKKEEFVTLWYKQVTTDKAGKKDSLSCVDDLKIENGKIALLDQKTRKFPAKK